MRTSWQLNHSRKRTTQLVFLPASDEIYQLSERTVFTIEVPFLMVFVFGVLIVLLMNRNR